MALNLEKQLLFVRFVSYFGEEILQPSPPPHNNKLIFPEWKAKREDSNCFDGLTFVMGCFCVCVCILVWLLPP